MCVGGTWGEGEFTFKIESRVCAKVLRLLGGGHIKYTDKKASVGVPFMAQ